MVNNMRPPLPCHTEYFHCPQYAPGTVQSSSFFPAPQFLPLIFLLYLIQHPIHIYIFKGSSSKRLENIIQFQNIRKVKYNVKTIFINVYFK